MLWRAALDAGWSVERLHGHRVPDGWVTQDAVFYGEGLLVDMMARQLDMALFETPYDWLPNLPFEYRLRNVWLMALREARALQERQFIKPAGEKTFDAGVYATGAELPSAEYFEDATPTLVSEVVEWEIEFRGFVAERALQTYAPYLRNGELLKSEDEGWVTNVPEQGDALAFFERILADERVMVPPGIVLDIGKIRGKGWAVIEANPAWGSGIYGNNPHKYWLF
ncbi:MAG: ATP-grasp domain-containing protein [Chloroflexi bacterium]|nr:ATP-grasp domain-containing protein [Chloroflexota bacterium]